MMKKRKKKCFWTTYLLGNGYGRRPGRAGLDGAGRNHPPLHRCPGQTKRGNRELVTGMDQQLLRHDETSMNCVLARIGS